MPHRLLGLVVLLKPGRSTSVEAGGLRLIPAQKLSLQELREQVVVAEPLVGVVEGGDEQVVARDGRRRLPASCSTVTERQRLGERRSRIEVCSRNRTVSAGCCARTSLAR